MIKMDYEANTGHWLCTDIHGYVWRLRPSFERGTPFTVTTEDKDAPALTPSLDAQTRASRSPGRGEPLPVSWLKGLPRDVFDLAWRAFQRGWSSNHGGKRTDGRFLSIEECWELFAEDEALRESRTKPDAPLPFGLDDGTVAGRIDERCAQHIYTSMHDLDADIIDYGTLAGDTESRRRNQPGEHPILSRLVVLRVHLNHEFGAKFREFDHELAQIELALVEVLSNARPASTSAQRE
jgi:hypothetical protein